MAQTSSAHRGKRLTSKTSSIEDSDGSSRTTCIRPRVFANGCVGVLGDAGDDTDIVLKSCGVQACYQPQRCLCLPLAEGMTRYHSSYAALLSLCAVMGMYWFSDAAVNSGLLVSPQGSQMSWMSPHYILQAEFNATWTPLARRYTLWLYKEKGFEDRHFVRTYRSNA